MSKFKKEFKDSIVLLSGGQDSTTCLYWAREVTIERVLALTIHYDQKHKIELKAAEKIAKMAGVEHEEIHISKGTFLGSSPLINPECEVEQYKGVDHLPGGLEDTFVPGRNLLFLVIAANRSYHHKIPNIVIGASQEDFGGYPDCRDSFFREAKDTLELAFNAPFVIHTPLIRKTKVDTVKLAWELPGCWQALSFSHTCYKGEIPPCGHCHACLLRMRGFSEAGFHDPLLERVK
jgi:7-cyano-7-deazaguanine synthase